MLHRQRIDPARQIHVQLGKRKFAQCRFQNFGNIVLRQLQTVHAHAARAVFLADRSAKRSGTLRARVGAVENNGERLSDLLQLADHTLLRRDIILAGYLADRTVARDDKPDGGMLGDYLIGSLLRRFGQRDLVIEPRRCHHALHAVLKLPGSALDHIANTVDEPHGKVGLLAQTDRYGFLRNEFRLGGHDGAPRSRLRQFVPRPCFHCLILQPRQNHQFHKLFNESALPGAHRANHTNIDIASGAAGNVSIQASGLHGHSPLFLHHHGHQQPHILLQSRFFQPVALLNGVW